jgi:hypothetical protein
MRFERNVFINCPFDDDYMPLLRPLLFSVYALGFVPRIALERLDSGRPRIDKIVALISASKFAIHDISRIRAIAAGEYFRLNMPFELGLDVGCRLFGRGKRATKRCLILESESYRYQAAISDLSGFDIAMHGDKPKKVVAEVRHWLNGYIRGDAASPSQIWADFIEFISDKDADLARRGYTRQDIEGLPIRELMRYMRDWLATRQRT